MPPWDHESREQMRRDTHIYKMHIYIKCDQNYPLPNKEVNGSPVPGQEESHAYFLPVFCKYFGL